MTTLHQIALGPNAVREALALAEAVADPARPGSAARLAVIVEELVYNLLDHGDPLPGATIRLSLTREAEGVRLVLIDHAAPFDPRDAPHVGTLPPDDRGGGAGLALVRAWSRIVAYSRIAGLNRLELVVLDDPDDP